MSKKKKENWGSQLGVILAVAGSAVGLGNFIRFPGQAAMNGGGAFMIPYFISFLIIAIPIACSEWALGRAGGRRGFNSVPGIYSLAGCGRKSWAYVGAIGAYIPLCISMYYLFVEAWCLAFSIQYFTGILNSLGIHAPSFLSGTGGPGMILGSAEGYSRFFAEFVGMNADGALYRSADGLNILTPLFGCTIFCLVFNYYFIWRGITKGIEAFCKVAMPLLVLCSLLILIRVVTLPNPTGEAGRSFLDGLGFMWNPTRPGQTLWQSLANPDVWLAATSQIFFSVSVGFGLIVTYASYVRPKDDIALSSLTATVSNEFCEVVLAGLMILPPAIMFLGASQVEGNLGLFSLGFNVLPNVFEQMPFGQFFGFLFFFLLFLAAVTSSLSMLQPTIALLEEGLNLGRKRSIGIMFIFGAVGTMILYHFSKNLYALDTFDFWVGNFGLFVMAMFQTILICWVWGTDKMYEELTLGAKIRIPRMIGWGLKYVSIPYLLVIFLFWTKKNAVSYWQEILSNPLAQLVIGYLVFTALFFCLVTYLAWRRWERVGKSPAQIYARDIKEESK